MAILSGIQALVEELNAVSTDLDVRDYVVSPEVKASIPGALDSIPEQLFVAEMEDGMELALYIDPLILAALDLDHPQSRLHIGNLENFCIALEGVSHFIKVVWSAQCGREVSALELEIQAEVDKFIGAWGLLVEQGMPRTHAARALRRFLFGQYELRADVPAAEAQRYHLASRVAGKFCERLVNRYPTDSSHRRVLRDARIFYRSGLQSMLRSQ